jgi:hypothetical protein
MVQAHILHPNVAGGLLAMTAPFLWAVGWRSGRDRDWPVFILVLAGLILVMVALLLTTSRGAWVALFVAGGLWLARGISLALARFWRQPERRVFAGLLLAAVGLAALFLLTFPGGVVNLLERLPGPANVGSRAELARDTLDLAADFPFTGGGLASFPGLYAQYARLTPFFMIIHSHNFLLDVMLEQGYLGFLALAAILVGTGWLLAFPSAAARALEHQTTLRLGLASALLVMLLHGLVEDPLYGSRGTLLILLLPGLAVALGRTERDEQPAPAASRLPVWAWAGPLVVLALVALLAFWQRDRLQGAWYANLGALEMAHVELAAFPTGKWDEGGNVAALAPAEALLQRAQQYDPENETAAYYLGLVAMSRRDYPAAVTLLELAQRQNDRRRGLRKALGYSYAWLGRTEPGALLLATIPEARQELEVYLWWWGTQGREDLATKADEMRAALRRSPISAE